MAKKLQIILPDPEYRKIEQASRSRRVSVAEWIQQALVHACHREAVADVEKKLGAIRVAAQYGAPTAGIETMLAEIEQGYLSGQQP